MRDSQMFNILESLKKAGSKKQNLNESAGNHTVSSHVSNDVNGDGMLQVNNQTSMRNIMDGINETLDKNQRRVNQMPGTHRMKKASRDKTHPAGKYLVGGEFDDETDLDEASDGYGAEQFKDVFAKYDKIEKDANTITRDKWNRMSPNEQTNIRKTYAGSHYYDLDMPSFMKETDLDEEFKWNDDAVAAAHKKDQEEKQRSYDKMNSADKGHHDAMKKKREMANEMDDPFDRSGPWDDEEEYEVDVDPGYDGTDDYGDDLEEDYDPKKTAYEQGKKDAKAGKPEVNASDVYGPHSSAYSRGYHEASDEWHEPGYHDGLDEGDAIGDRIPGDVPTDGFDHSQKEYIPVWKIILGGFHGKTVARLRSKAEAIKALKIAGLYKQIGWGIEKGTAHMGSVDTIDEVITGFNHWRRSDGTMKGNGGKSFKGDDLEEARGRLQGTDRENDDWEPEGGKFDWSNNLSRSEPVDWDDYDDVPDLERDLERKDYFDDPMNKRHYESVEEATPDEWNDAEDAYNDNYGPEDDSVEDDSTIANKWRKGGPKDDRHYESVEEVYDPETMTFRKQASVMEDDIEEDTIADKSTSRKHGLHKEKSSFKDIFKSMSETDEDKEKTLEQELHTEIKNNVMKKNKNGKYNLNDNLQEDETSQQVEIIKGKIQRTMDLLKTIPTTQNTERAPVLAKMKELNNKLKSLQNKKSSKEVNPNSREYNTNIPTHNLY